MNSVNAHTSPQVSICATCYNHEKYIPFFMKTLMEQDFQDWELVVTDDYSTDYSYEMLTQYTCDPRVRVYRNERNRHIGHTTNNSLSKARGKYVCLISVDDGLVLGKLSHDYNYLETHADIAVLYSNLIIIGEDSVPTGAFLMHPAGLERYQSLNFMFTHGNRMLIPGIFFRRECLDVVGLFNPLLCLTQDYEFNIRLMLNYEMAISDTPTVYYRRRDNDQNVSAYTPQCFSHIANETALLLDAGVQQIKNIDQFKKIFPDFKKYDPINNEDVLFYVGLVLSECKNSAVRMAGLKMLYNFVADRIDYLEQQYGFSSKDFMSLTREVDIFGEHKYMLRIHKKSSLLERLLCGVWRSLTRKLKRRGLL